MPGRYELVIQCSFADGSTGRFPFAIEIAKAMRPWENVQVNAWNEYRKEFAGCGFSMAGSQLDPARIDELAREGLYGNYNLNYFGTPRAGHAEEIAIDSFGKPLWPDVRSQYIRDDIARRARETAAFVSDAPTFKAIVLNSEIHAGGAGNNGSFSFSPTELARAASFGLDLNRWRLTGEKNDLYRKFLPLGGLVPTVAPELIPADGVVKPDHPLYGYLRERHGSSGGTEVVINDLLAREMLAIRPDWLMMQDPVLRRPALRSYRSINVAQDWFYYPDPAAIVAGAEDLVAVRRSMPGMSTSVMPQFLFKHGMAAPFAGMPPRDMFREACYLAASRPMRVISFWNAGNALIKGNQLDADEIRALLGDGTYAQTDRIMKERKLDPFCFDPRLKEEFKALSEQLWLPLGALMPKWENAPRRLALVNSFAGHLFGNIRWPGSSPLRNAVVKSGIPFDILLDNDLEQAIGDYDIVVLPDGYALPEAAVANLQRFMERGGTLIADASLRITPLKSKAVILELPRTQPDAEAARQIELALERSGGKSDSPVFLEAMQEFAAAAAANAESPQLRQLLREKLQSAFNTDQKSVYWNHLRGGGGEYLFAVNDLRVPGPIYGRFGKVAEQGVARQVVFHVGNPAWRYAYDLLTQKRSTVESDRLTLNLPPCGGTVLLLTKEPIGKLGGEVTSQHELVLRMNPAPGLIPVRIELVQPDGTVFSDRYDVLTDGELNRMLAIPVNAPVGRWTVRAAELASGQSVEIAFPVRSSR